MPDFNVAAVHEAIAAAVPERLCLVWRDRRLTWADVDQRTRRLANWLLDRGVQVPVQREFLDGHESGQDHLGVYLHNGNEYLEAMVGAWKARVAPFNVNYRYVADELEHLLRDAQCRALVYHEAFTPTLAAVRDRVPGLDLLLCVADGSGHGLLPGAVWYEEALASSSPARPDAQRMGGDWSPDDLYILYTGGTTGLPKGVLWRQGDIFSAALGGRHLRSGNEWPTVDALVDAARRSTRVALPAPPFMHGAGHWIAFQTLHQGGTVVIQDVVTHLDPVDVLSTIERERVDFVLIVGDAFGRPLLDELEQPSRGRAYDLSSLRFLVSGGAVLSAALKDRFLAAVPGLTVIDALGSSEAGSQTQQLSSGGSASSGTFPLGEGNHVLSEDLSHPLAPGHEGVGWLARSGRLPLGYLGDPEKSARTFPTIGGVRYVVTGDRARLLAPAELGGTALVELHGRDAVTINTGGEKVFAEEVEAALRHHPAVYDCVVSGRPSERWGSEVVAVVQLAPGATATAEEVLAAAADHIARFKLPKEVVFRDRIVRSPSGKADYRWAKAVAAGEA